MTIASKRVVLVITASTRPNIRQAMVDVDPAGAARCFSVPLFREDDTSPSHFWCSWAIDDVEEVLLRRHLFSRVGVMIFNGYTLTPEQILDRMRLHTKVPTIGDY